MAPKDQNFSNNGVDWNIHLEDTGELSFKADGKNGNGEARMVIRRGTADVEIGGSGVFGQLHLKSNINANTAFLGTVGNETFARLGGQPNQSGHIQLLKSNGLTTVDLDGDKGELILGTEGEDGKLLIQNNAGNSTMTMDGQGSLLDLFQSDGETLAMSMSGEDRVLRLCDPDGDVKVILQSAPDGLLELKNNLGVSTVSLKENGALTLGADGGSDSVGVIILNDSQGSALITCNGFDGVIQCVELVEEPIPLVSERSIAPLMNALDRVLALRGVTYPREQVTAPMAPADADAQQIGFVCQELEAVCPELVATNAEGHKSVSYSRMTAVLVEAVKEQQQQIHEQAAAIEDISKQLGQLSAAAQGAGQV